MIASFYPKFVNITYISQKTNGNMDNVVIAWWLYNYLFAIYSSFGYDIPSI